ncbi:Mpo1 family 2-hydroxy fatty acid dioxygenase [Kordiimonas aestuarii]|uniref:Mpo1 family 2-hydroxy fatty acid dioxygenase n=1 Tax=Kordiimonas aestuarii TaxID=1005925 RepID=UPI0021D09661|nr:Mpo1-like protein [Kordiimonas aestuarii]
MKNWFYEQMAMYSAYHRDGRNQATHHIGVPMIVFSVLVITSTIPLFATSAGPVTVGAALMAVLVLFYIVAAPLVGTIAALLYGALAYGAAEIAAMGDGVPLKVFLALFIVGWIIQFWGHKYEGRKPALFDNILQIFMAPSFLIAELLFMAGLEEDLHGEIKARMPKYLPK